MDRDVTNNKEVSLNDSDERPRSAVNAAVLDYYKKFGRKRDLEQYFSLSTAQSEIRDPRSLFWRRMKEQSDTSDSGEKKSESSNEICRISIQCSVPRLDPQKDNSPPKSDSESPPIITDVLPGPSHSGDDSVDDNHSQKSVDGTLDSSINKPLSPTSSITSQRKLEWDSLADVGYGNESDRKTSASSLSTLEREVLAQKQQYTLDFKQNSDLGLPTAHSTPVDPNDNKSKNKKGQGKKTTSFSKKDVDIVNVKVPQNLENAHAINVNLTKQFSVSLGKDGGITLDTEKRDFTVIPEAKSVGSEISPAVKLDKEIQTLLTSKEKAQSSADCLKTEFTSQQNVPVYICLTTVKKRHKRKKVRKLRSKSLSRKKSCMKKETVQEKEKSGEQVSEAESFEYMPGHIYNQNQLNENSNMPSNNNAGNKSSLESSAVHTTDSSKESKCCFTKELNKSLDVLKFALKDKYDSNLKKKLVKEIIQRLLKSNYADDGSTPDFLSVLSLHSKKTPTTSTSEGDNSGEKMLQTKPKKSILRSNTFNSKELASTSQSAPNLPFVTNSENPVISYLPKQVSSTSTDTDPSANYSAKEISSSDTIFAKTSSEELLKKYIDALKKEEAYKQHLKDKHLFLRQKLFRSDTGLKVPVQLDVKTNNKLKDLIKDLTRNNYDDGSGDASKLEGGSNSNFDFGNGNRVARKHRSHSVFTLSSGNSNLQNRDCYPRHNEQKEIPASSRAGPSHCIDHNEPYKKHAYIQTNVTDSSVQVNIKCINEDEKTHPIEVPLRTIAGIPPTLTEDIKYVCLCTEKSLASEQGPDEFLIYKCLKLPINMTSTGSNTVNVPYYTKCTSPKHNSTASSTENKSKPKPEETGSITNLPLLRKTSKSSQTNNSLTSQTPHRQSAKSTSSSSSEQNINNEVNTNSKPKSNDKKKIIHESTRCLQTEISIHPKISDPALSDVNIINSEECVKLISELYRKVSYSSSERNLRQHSSEKDEANPCSCKSSKANINVWDKQSHDNLSADERDIAPLINKPIEGSCHSTMPHPERNSDKIIIPIEGTRMTLKVSIAGRPPTPPSSNPRKDMIQKETSCYVESANKEITTKIIENTENYTCISTECSKAVQSENVPDIFRNNQCYPNERKPVEVVPFNTGVEKNTAPNQCYLNEEKPVDAFQSNTYPKTIHMNVRKPLLRHNTDICINTEAVCPIRLDSENNYDDLNKRNKETQPLQKKHLLVNKKQPRPKDNSKWRFVKSNETSSDHSVSENPKADSIKITRSSTISVPEAKNLKSNMVKGDGTTNDMILDMIQDITKRYSKEVSEKRNKKRCYEEILKVLDFLLDTDDSGDGEQEHSKNSQSSEENILQRDSLQEQQWVPETLSHQSTPDKGALNKLPEKHSDLKPQPMEPKNKTLYKEYALQFLNINNNFESTSTQAVSPESIKILINKNIHDQSDVKKENLKQKTDGGDIVRKRQGDEESSNNKSFHDHNGTKKKCSKQKTDGGNKEFSVCSSGQETDRENCPKTCSIACGCEKPECQVKFEHGDENYNTDITKPNLRSIHQKTEGSDMQSSESSKPESISGFTNLKSDGGRKLQSKTCKLDEGNKKSFVCKKSPFVCKKNETPQESCPKTCTVACGCDEPDCKDRPEYDDANYKTDITKQTLSSMHQDTESSEQLCPQFCDIACGCDEPGCQDRSESGVENYKTDITKTYKSLHQETSKSSIKTCDKSVGRDNTLESKDSSCCDCVKYKSNKYDHKCFGCKKHKSTDKCTRNLVSKCVQSTARKVKMICSQRHCSSQCPISSDQQSTYTDSPTGKIINKIKKECEKYQKRSRTHINEASSSTSANCEHCNRANWHCSCRGQKCRGYRTRTTMEKTKKKCVAYNLVLQTSDSVASEEQPIFDRHCRPLQNIVLKVPKQNQGYIPFKELYAKIEQKYPSGTQRCSHKNRSRSWPHEGGISSTDDVKMAQARTVRDYLERNRPDFVERSTDRQNCIRTLSRSRPECCSHNSPRMKTIVVHSPNCTGCTGPTTMYCGGAPMSYNCTDPCLKTIENEVTRIASERSRQIEVLSMQLGGLQTQTLTEEEMRHLAKEYGLGQRRTQPKFISEREMKKHSEKIFKSLPEVRQKKEDAKKESMKRTNLLMASLFKKNLQKKTLRGAVNLSNYSTVIKI